MSSQTKKMEWGRLGEFFLVFFILPVILFWAIAQEWPGFLRWGYFFIVTLFVFQSAMSYLQTTATLIPSIWDKRSAEPVTPVPRTTFIVSAYLPNEVTVIEATLLNLLQNVKRPNGGIEVILAYNTPQMMELEKRLHEMVKIHPELILANAYGSRSKSQNQNYALDIASGEMIVLLDADHLVAQDCLARAWRWLEDGFDVVQGRCVIRNGSSSLVSALVSVEFQAIYGVSHFAKFRLFRTALFGGSNGYWRASVLKTIRFRNDRLTEDIDATLRATLAGYRFIHDRSILSSEEAPTTWTGLWFQRKRWSQGWYQCSVVYQKAVWQSQHLNLRKKFIWTTLLLWRVFYDLVSHLLFPILAAYWLYRGQIELPVTPYVLFAVGFTMLSGPYEMIAAWIHSVPRYSPLRYLLYGAATFFYSIYKNIVQVIAIRDELAGSKEWVMTTRADS
ncbi:MAG: glycosyltransferase [Kiritimatiellales bacterium]